MKNTEFKITKSKDQTVFTLESATGGGGGGGVTSSANVSSNSVAVGGVRRRAGGLVTSEDGKETITIPVTQKPRQGPLRPQTGAGTHRDKKKEQKQGQEKHKKPYYEDHSDAANRGWGAGSYDTYANTRHGRGVAENDRPDHEISMASSELNSIAKDAENLLHLIRKYSEQQGLQAWQQSKITKAADYLNSVLQSVSGEQGVAEGLNEFAPDGFNGGDDGEEFNPRMAKMAYDEGVVKGASLADGATLQRAMAINDWGKHDGGIYSQHFAKGFKAGRLDKIRHNNKQYNLNLKLMKDGSIRHGEQGVAEGDMSRRGFLKGLGAAALGATALGAAGKAQANQDQDLGNGFVLTTIDVLGGKFKAVLDTQSNTHYMPNRHEGGNAIVRSMAPFITIKNGQINTTMSVGPATQAAMKKAGLLKGIEEGDSGAKYKVKSIGYDNKGDYYISPSTGKKVYKKADKGDHENPKTGEIKKKVAEAGFVDVTNMSNRDVQRLGHHDDPAGDRQQQQQDAMPKLVGMYFYDIQPGEEEKAHSLGIKQIKSGKWAMKIYDKSGASSNYRQKLANQWMKELGRAEGKYWAMKEDAYMESLAAKLAEKIPANAPVKAWIDDFANAAKTPNAKGHHQFKNKSPEKVRQMAMAASYAAKNPSKKK